jgi:hypothetical protein
LAEMASGVWFRRLICSTSTAQAQVSELNTQVWRFDASAALPLGQTCSMCAQVNSCNQEGMTCILHSPM